MSFTDHLQDNKFFSKIGITQLKNLARNLDIEIKDIKRVGNYRNKLRWRILEQFRGED